MTTIAMAWHAARDRVALAVGVGLTGLFALTALISLFWTPHEPTRIDIRRRLAPPSADHWLGTDPFGRDLASLLMAGAQNSIAVGVIAVAIGLFVGVALGLIAAERRGIVDEIVMRACDFVFAFPAILLAILFVAWLGPGAINAIVAIGIFNVPVFARLTRSSAVAIWARPFVLAARAAGKSGLAISIEHILPNIAAIIVVQATVQFAIAILAEAALSYLGLGAQPPAPSWGRMLSEAQTLIYLAPMLAVYPGAAIALAVLGLNVLGDALRDRMDPRLARRRE